MGGYRREVLKMRPRIRTGKVAAPRKSGAAVALTLSMPKRAQAGFVL
jgi:hypothetical protein